MPRLILKDWPCSLPLSCLSACLPCSPLSGVPKTPNDGETRPYVDDVHQVRPAWQQNARQVAAGQGIGWKTGCTGLMHERDSSASNLQSSYCRQPVVAVPEAKRFSVAILCPACKAVAHSARAPRPHPCLQRAYEGGEGPSRVADKAAYRMRERENDGVAPDKGDPERVRVHQRAFMWKSCEGRGLRLCEHGGLCWMNVWSFSGLPCSSPAPACLSPAADPPAIVSVAAGTEGQVKNLYRPLGATCSAEQNHCSSAGSSRLYLYLRSMSCTFSLYASPPIE